MGIAKFKYFITLTLLMGCGLALAQQDRYQVRLGVGVGNSYGEEGMLGEGNVVGDDAVSISSEFLTYQAFVEIFLSKAWSIGTQVHSMPGIVDVQGLQVYGAYYLDNGYLLGDRSFLSLFVKAGAGYDVREEATFLPLGGGLKFRISSRINLNVEMQYRYFTDQIQDEVMAPERMTYYSGLTLSYNFGRHKESFAAPALYTGRGAAPARASAPTIPPRMDETSAPAESMMPAEVAGERIQAAQQRTQIDTASFMGRKLHSPTLLKADSLRSRLRPMQLLEDTAEVEPQVARRTAATPRQGSDSLAQYRDSVLRQMRFEVEKLSLEKHLERLRQPDTVRAAAAVTAPAATPPAAATTPEGSMQAERIRLLEQRINLLEQTNQDLRNRINATPAREAAGAETQTTRVEERPRTEGFDAGQTSLIAAQSERLRRVENQLDQVLQRMDERPASARDTAYVFSSSRDTLVAATDTSAAVLTREMQKMQQQLVNLRSQLDSAERARQEEMRKPVEEKTAPLTTRMVFFAVNSTSLPATGRQDLQEVLAHADQNPKARYRIVGFTDKTGSAEYNQVLSEKRARRVKEFLVQNGISEDRLQVESRGIDESLEERSAQYGRRVEVRLAAGSGS